MGLNRLIESVLRRYDSEERELVLRWRLWKMEWLPYKTAEYLGYDEKKQEMKLGPWKWNKPDRWTKD